MGHLFLPEETNNPAVIILGLGNYPDSCIDGNRAFEFDAQGNKLVIYASPSRSIAKNDGGLMKYKTNRTSKRTRGSTG
ncbi:unnamed protein product [Acanthoscelides obtectus]|uniref:Uncharacterized protein n=1 Tax=Acanthoscelides obtectus TaxID=200917 RepID=A0A9P0MHC4_ACAOB|nr:unnamed protein product [Acanthoscelides obtectus]CAK1659210.1 hypothetical protein AOBTE_LOCUS21346 [Acanthoscelides obtectus]